MYDVSIVVCTKNVESTIEICLKSIEKNNPSEIIIVDGCSKDKTLEIARKHTSRVYSDDGKGIGYARQLGAEKAQSQYVAYIDADVVLCENVIENLIDELIKKNYSAIHAQLHSLSNKTYWEWAADQHLNDAFNAPGERNTIGNVVVVMKKETIMKIKFDPYFYRGSEDYDFYTRLRESGNKIGIGEAYSYHKNRTNIKTLFSQHYSSGIGFSRMYWKYKNRKINKLTMNKKMLFSLPSLIHKLKYCVKCNDFKMIPYWCVVSISIQLGIIDGLVNLHKNNRFRMCLASERHP